MFKRNKIITTLVIVLVCSGVALVLLQKEGRSSASETDIPDTDLPAKRLTTKSDMRSPSALGNDSLYDHLSNHPSWGEERLLFYKDSLIALSRQVKDSTIQTDSSLQQEKAEPKDEFVLLWE